VDCIGNPFGILVALSRRFGDTCVGVLGDVQDVWLDRVAPGLPGELEACRHHVLQERVSGPGRISVQIKFAWPSVGVAQQVRGRQAVGLKGGVEHVEVAVTHI
jgi:hypothetical protein